MKKFLIFILFNLLIFNFIKAETYLVDANKIFKNLRCLVCQGQSIAESNSDYAQTIKLVVRDQINDGKSEKEIYDFLIEKYGEWMVYDPPFTKNNLLLWIIPYLVFLGGGILIFFLVRQNNQN